MFFIFFPNVQAEYHNDELETGIGHISILYEMYLQISIADTFWPLKAKIFRHVGIAFSWNHF